MEISSPHQPAFSLSNRVLYVYCTLTRLLWTITDTTCLLQKGSEIPILAFVFLAHHLNFPVKLLRVSFQAVIYFL